MATPTRPPDGNPQWVWDDTARLYWTWDTNGIPTSRPYTTAENAMANQQATEAAQLTDLETRVARIEAQLWPPPAAPTDTTGVPTWTTLGGVWPNGGLLLDTGTVYRNISGVPLTTAPSAFPGDVSQWTHLFVVALAAPPPPPTGTPWSGASVAYKVGDVVTYNGHTYTCAQAHTSQAGWDPVSVPALWTKVS